MPFTGCSNGLIITALVAVLLVPTPYYVTDFYDDKGTSLTSTEEEIVVKLNWFEDLIRQFPPVDLFASILLMFIGLFCFICELIQRKIMERRIKKLNQSLIASFEQLSSWDTKQEQLEATLNMVQNATSEYNLLLYLLLRQHRCIQPQQTNNCFIEKDLDEDLNFLRNIEV